jgi:hypothetical protein
MYGTNNNTIGSKGNVIPPISKRENEIAVVDSPDPPQQQNHLHLHNHRVSSDGNKEVFSSPLMPTGSENVGTCFLDFRTQLAILRTKVYILDTEKKISLRFYSSTFHVHVEKKTKKLQRYLLNSVKKNSTPLITFHSGIQKSTKLFSPKIYS